VHPYPPGCTILQGGECTRGLTALIITPIMGIFLGAIPFVGILICMIMIVYRVHKTYAASLPSSMQQRLNERTKQTAIQSILYIGAILIPYTLIIINLCIQNTDRNVRFILGILVKLMIPLQGVFNFFIYIRPRLMSMRERDGYSTSFHMLVWQIVNAGTARGSPDEESDFAPELKKPHISSQIDVNGQIKIASCPA
jgi:Na+/melibiose symporter-like transporter